MTISYFQKELQRNSLELDQLHCFKLNEKPLLKLKISHYKEVFCIIEVQNSQNKAYYKENLEILFKTLLNLVQSKVFP